MGEQKDWLGLMPTKNYFNNVRNLLAVPLCLLVVCLVLFQRNDPAIASDISTPPPRAAEVISTLKFAQWEQLDDGLMLHQAYTALGTRLTALKMSADKFRFSIEQQSSPTGERASSVLERTSGHIAINGGFFGQKNDGSLYPVGQLIDDGVSHSTPWSNVGGYLAIGKEGNPDIIPSSNGLPAGIGDAVQTKPVLIEAGGLWAMNTNGTELARRSLVCILGDGDILLVVVSGGGLTLYEAGWILRSPKWGGFYDCDRAIAMDGGGSTQLQVRDNSQLDVTGLTPVQNLLVVHKR
jgi:exopolysaccharide biosynthesis protein